ncbi:hypothetical protein BC938DRAFT_483058 [Jimgerdemannia flammicorona]|uniref:ubiquitinyl hydrolase 1 n=1 Tax=Jimgerdemannia flammicorona TaxID=994334 RepID=A0A433QCM8_9FUNG|nr:hypothetical protein BC938DRAFT_483058 [Jimgerdemannia flammicorona]
MARQGRRAEADDNPSRTQGPCRPSETASTLDLHDRVSPGRLSGIGLYRLYAVLVHVGASFTSGHYHCFIKGSDSEWYSTNDTSVKPVSLTTVLRERAYAVLYTGVTRAGGGGTGVFLGLEILFERDC